MGFIFGWLPNPSDVAQEDWAQFLNSYSAIFIVLMILTIVAIIAAYRYAAFRLKIYSVDDVFQSYTPLRWLALAIGGAAIAAGIGYMKYSDQLHTPEGGLGFASLAFLMFLIVAGGLGYGLIVLFSILTPAKFAARPAPFLKKKVSAR